MPLSININDIKIKIKIKQLKARTEPTGSWQQWYWQDKLFIFQPLLVWPAH